MAEVLFLAAAALRLVTASGEAHDHGDDDGDLHGADDGRDEDVVQLLTTGDDVEDVEIQQLITLWSTVRRLTPAGRQVVPHLTLAVFTKLGVVLGAGGGALHKPLPFAGFRHSVDVGFGLGAVVFSVFI